MSENSLFVIFTDILNLEFLKCLMPDSFKLKTDYLSFQVNILDDGRICLEFIRNKNSQDYVIEVLHISPDGLKVSFNLTNEL